MKFNLRCWGRERVGVVVTVSIKQLTKAIFSNTLKADMLRRNIILASGVTKSARVSTPIMSMFIPCTKMLILSNKLKWIKRNIKGSLKKCLFVPRRGVDWGQRGFRHHQMPKKCPNDFWVILLILVAKISKKRWRWCWESQILFFLFCSVNRIRGGLTNV